VNWHCFHCQAAIAFVEADGEIGPTLSCKRLHVIGGTALYCCLECGAVQIPTVKLSEELLKWQEKEKQEAPLAPHL
jgi:hypothetical protein